MRYPFCHRCIASALLASLLSGCVFKSEPPEVTEEGRWQVRMASLPALPKAENLIPVPLDGALSNYRFFIDRASLAQGRGGSVRYTMVMESPHGVRNVLVERIHCEAKKYKTEAYEVDGALHTVRSPKWKAIPPRGVQGYRALLRKTYLCDEGGKPRAVDEMIQRLDQESIRGGHMGMQPLD